MSDDLINRQAALNSPVTMVSEGLDWIPAYHVKDLPSAEPEIIHCCECKSIRTATDEGEMDKKKRNN